MSEWVKMIGVLQEKESKTGQSGKSYLSIKVNGVWLSAWPDSAAYAALGGIGTGQNIEVSYSEKGKFKNAHEVAIQGDGVPATAPASTPAPQKSYHKAPYQGKSPEERMGILAQSANHDATPIICEWIKAESASNPAWLIDNWEKVVKAHANIAAAIADASLDYLANQKGA